MLKLRRKHRTRNRESENIFKSQYWEQNKILFKIGKIISKELRGPAEVGYYACEVQPVTESYPMATVNCLGILAAVRICQRGVRESVGEGNLG